ncbi:MAG: hypothetical protein E6276_01990 [Clostridiales bacterium]|nr:hypothetical protein [Clostridiales bacterium]MDU7244154.1 hypothetical protein [Clostridiales bacterium]
MARILDTQEQKEALREIMEGLRQIEDIDRLLASDKAFSLGILGDNKLKISFDTASTEEIQIRRLLAKLRAKIAKKIPPMADKYHIALTDGEECLLVGEREEALP